MVKQVCKICNKIFYRRRKQGCCSRKCFFKSRFGHIIKNCINCGKQIKIFKCHAKRGQGKYCSKKCFHESTNITGHKNPNWKGGRKYISKNRRHILVYCPTHPNCDRHGNVLEHRLVMEKHIKRYLLSTEVVHHINNIKDDNRIENLQLFKTSGEHSKYHRHMEKLNNFNFFKPKVPISS